MEEKISITKYLPFIVSNNIPIIHFEIIISKTNSALLSLFYS